MDYVENRPMGTIAGGELAGSVTAVQGPDVPCRLVWLKARSDNVGSVFLGPSTVTAPNGSTDVTTGYELAPGEPLGPLPIGNLNKLWRICENAGDDLTYLVGL